MASYFNLTLDTTAPLNPSITAPARFSGNMLTVTASADGATQIRIGGYPNHPFNMEGWESINSDNQYMLPFDSGVDGEYIIQAQFMDAVGNATNPVSCTVIWDTTVPTVTIIGPDVSTISKMSGYDKSEFSFTASEAIKAWEVRVVPSVSSLHTAGTLIGTTNGSTNTSATNTTKPQGTAVNVSIRGADLQAASSGDGVKIVKVFVQGTDGDWSV